MIVIGITGPTGAGKTTALGELQRLGGAIIDCDAVYHELLKSNIALQEELERAFGNLRDEDGAIDRKKLGAVVFRDPAALAALDAWISAAGSEEITYYGTFDIGNQYDAWRRELFDGDSRASWEVMVMREDGSVTSLVSDAPHPIQKIFQNIRAFAERVGGITK